MTPRKIAGLISIILVSELTAVSVSLVALSLPQIAAKYQTADIGWVMSLPNLTAVIVMCLIGKLADLRGKRLVLLVMIALVILGSLICAVAPSFELFLLGRFLQGIIFGTPAIAYSLIRDVFPKRVVAFATAVAFTGSGVAMGLSPFVAGWLMVDYGFESLFWFMLVYQMICFIGVILTLPETPLRKRSRLDWVGALIIGLGGFAVTFALGNGSKWGWTSFGFLGLIAAGVICFAVFTWWEKRFSEPLIDLKLLQTKAMRTTLGSVFFIFAALGILSAITPMMLQTPRAIGVTVGFGLVGAAVAAYLLPEGLARVFGGMALGGGARRWGIKNPMVIAFIVLTVSCLGLAFRHSTEWEMMLWLVLFGFTNGVLFGGWPILVMQATPPDRQGVTSSFVLAFGNLAAVIAIQVAFVVLAPHAQVGGGNVWFSGEGYQVAFVITAGICVIGTVFTMTLPHGRRRDSLEMRAGEEEISATS